jgi:hypothetical protein
MRPGDQQCPAPRSSPPHCTTPGHAGQFAPTATVREGPLSTQPGHLSEIQRRPGSTQLRHKSARLAIQEADVQRHRCPTASRPYRSLQAASPSLECRRSTECGGSRPDVSHGWGAAYIFVRTVVVWHITWSVNSAAHLWGYRNAAHLWGYRNYETDEQSCNNWVVAILTSGEGWHNNHHAAPRSARHGRRRWELDLIFAFIRLLELAGLAWDVARPDHRLIAARSDRLT